jgi:2-oxoglutarate ferredoxin oxidoreductase subunit gamma
MQVDVIFSGFGGQGALFAGQLLAYAAMDEGRYVTWIPSYGPEMRGGTAHCTVIVSEQQIGSPLVRHPTNVVALNNPSVERYESLLAPGGLLIYNSSLTLREVARPGIRALAIPGSGIAADMGNAKLLNMLLLGALVMAAQVLPVEAIERALEQHLSANHRGLLELNKLALRRGAELAQHELALA